MGIIRYDITERNFTANAPDQYELSVLAGTDSSSYMFANIAAPRQISQVRAINHQPNESWWLADNHLSKWSNLPMKVSIVNSVFTLVPSRLYSVLERKTYLEHLAELTDDQVVMADELASLDLMLVYAVPELWLNQWRQHFSNARFLHYLSPLLALFKKTHLERGLYRQVFANVRDNSIAVAAFDGGKLHFANAFDCQEAKDFLYYCLLACDQCQWTNQETQLCLSGEILPSGAIYLQLTRYFRDIQWFPMPPGLQASDQLKQQPAHLFTDLAAIQLY